MTEITKSQYEIVFDYWCKNKDKPTSWINYAELTAKTISIDEAKKIYEKGLKRESLKKPLLATRYAQFSVKYLDFENTKLAFEKALKITKKDSLFYAYAQWLIDVEKYDEAEVILSDLIPRYDTNQVNFALAYIYRKKLRLIDAVKVYERLIEKNESNSQAWKELRETELLLNKNSDENQIIKSISFKPEHHIAGLSILQNFGNLLNEKYPNGDVAFTIKQNGLKITMVIDHPEGDKEVVEDYLTRYGLVITGQMTPESFSQNPMLVMDLKRQLLQLESDLKWANEKQNMLQGIIVNQDNQISFLQKQATDFHLQLNSVFTSNKVEISELISIIKNKDDHENYLVDKLIDSIRNNNAKEAKDVAKELSETNPGIITKIQDFIVTTMASAGGNAPAWIDYLSKAMP